MKHARIDRKTFDDVKRLLEIKDEKGWKSEVAKLLKLSRGAVYKIAKNSDYEAYDQDRSEWAEKRRRVRKSAPSSLKPVLYTTQAEVLLSSIDQSLKGILSLLLKQENVKQEAKQSFWEKLSSKQVS